MQEWLTIHTIPGAHGVTVRVQRRGDIRPQYSVQLGRERTEPGEDRLSIFVPVFTRMEDEKVAIDRQGEALLTAAYDWIETDAARYRDNYATPRTTLRKPQPEHVED